MKEIVVFWRRRSAAQIGFTDLLMKTVVSALTSMVVFPWNRCEEWMHEYDYQNDINGI